MISRALGALEAFMGRRSRAFFAVAVLSMIAVIAVADYFSTRDVDLSILYILPIFFAVWYLGAWPAIIAALLSSAALFTTNRLVGGAFENMAFDFWDTFVPLLFYGIVIVLMLRLKRALAREEELSRTDTLTGLPNRRSFYQTANLELSRAERYGHAITLAYIDLDNFKEVNDTLGHEEGDSLLVGAAETMRQNLRSTDVVARIGGDEFAVLLPETPEIRAARALGHLCKTFAAAMKERGWPVTMSVGSVSVEGVKIEVDDLVSKADALMYQVKDSGRNGLVHESLSAPEEEYLRSSP